MDVKIKINTGEGMNSFKTKKLVGELYSLIISSKEDVDIKIISDIGYDILDIMQFNGIEYFPLRIQNKDKKGHGLNYQADSLILNESIIINVSGIANNDVDIILRMI